MMAITRGLLPLVVIMSVWTINAAGTHVPQPVPQTPPAKTAPVESPAVLTEQRLEQYARCRETLDPIAIQAVLEAHGRMIRRVEAAAGGMLKPWTNPLQDAPLPVYGEALVEWLADDGTSEFIVAAGDPFMDAASSSPQAGAAAAELQRQAARCGLGAEGPSASRTSW